MTSVKEEGGSRIEVGLAIRLNADLRKFLPAHREIMEQRFQRNLRSPTLGRRAYALVSLPCSVIGQRLHKKSMTSAQKLRPTQLIVGQ